jgi:hypothetical protein
VATAATNTKQYSVEDRATALLYYNGALRQEDCRLAIYPNYEKLIENGSLPPTYKPIPNHLFMELDLKDFEGDIDKLDSALKSTLRRIKRELNGAVPSVLWSGGGFHIHQPLDIDKALEELEEFKKHENVSVKFLRYAARQLSAGKSDPNHNISFKSCLCRVPGSSNSKYQGEVAEVKIVQRWNGVRANPTSQFITEFLISLTQKDIDKNLNKWKNPVIRNSTAVAKTTTTAWIERLLQTPIADYRKGARDLILVPYLVVRRGLGPNEAYTTIMKWAIECDKLRPLQPSRKAFSDRVQTRIQEVVRNRIPPMSMQALHEMNPSLCEKLTSKS